MQIDLQSYEILLSLRSVKPNYFHPTPSADMKIAILQHDIAWASPHTNRANLDTMFDTLPQADLYVLCEMWATGFATQPDGTHRVEDPPRYPYP